MPFGKAVRLLCHAVRISRSVGLLPSTAPLAASPLRVGPLQQILGPSAQCKPPSCTTISPLMCRPSKSETPNRGSHVSRHAERFFTPPLRRGPPAESVPMRRVGNAPGASPPSMPGGVPLHAMLRPVEMADFAIADSLEGAAGNGRGTGFHHHALCAPSIPASAGAGVQSRAVHVGARTASPRETIDLVWR